MGFSRSNDPLNSVKALKADRVIRIKLQSQVHDLHSANILEEASCKFGEIPTR